jgi:hypothetical protein
MPYYKRRQPCTQKSGKKGTFLTIKKDGGKRQCWKSEEAFKRAVAARHAGGFSEADEQKQNEEELSEKKKKKKKKGKGRWDKAKTHGLPSGIQPTLSFTVSESAKGAVDAESAKALIKKYAKGLKSAGINADNVESFPVMGIGTHGTAFGVGPDQVLKITNDAQEAAVANALLNVDLPNVVKFYDIWTFGDTGLFGILQEKLEPLPADDAQEFNDAMIATGLPVWVRQGKGSWDTVKKLIKGYVIKQLKKKFDDLKGPEARAYADDINKKWSMLVDKYGVADMYKTLSGLGIDFHDYHAGNMMKRPDGTLVLIDLGISKLKGGGGQVRSIDEAYIRALRQLIREELGVISNLKEHKMSNKPKTVKIKLGALKEIIKETMSPKALSESADPFTDSVVSSWVKFVGRHPEARDELLEAWDNMTSGMSMRDVVSIFSKAIGYEKPPGVAAGMPERGSEEEYLLGLRSGVKFHARKIKPGQTYPTSEEVVEELTGRITKQKERKAADLAQKKWVRPKYGYGTRIDPETGKKVSWTGTHERFN